MTGHRFPAGEKGRLTDEERRRRQSADDIIGRMDLSLEDVAADLGCGPGYITIPLARKVAKVMAVDVQQEMLDALMEAAPEEVRRRVVPALGELPHIPLANRSVDRAVLVNVIHEVDDLPLLEMELRRVLVPQGRLSVVDFPRRETAFGPPPEERLDPEDIEARFPSFRTERRWDLTDYYQLEMVLERS
jgi:ubiquinone/menaquinone biosynthesis C-methylase UbiE